MDSDDMDSNSKPGYNIGDWLKDEAIGLKRGVQKKYQSAIDEIMGDKKDAKPLEMTARVFTWFGRRVADASVEIYKETAETYTPAKEPELKFDGLEAKIGSALAIPSVGKKRAKECRELCEKLAAYEIANDLKDTILRDASAYAMTSMDELLTYYRSEKLRRYPTLAKDCVSAMHDYEVSVEKKKKHDALLVEITGSKMDDRAKGILTRKMETMRFESLNDIKRYLIHDDTEISQDDMNLVLREISKHEAPKIAV